MCTVTVIPLPPGGFRVACNRDESRARPATLPPLLSWAGDVRAVMPIDPHAGGTWIAATDRGMVFTLLNYNPTPPPKTEPGGNGLAASRRPSLASRGTIIPFLSDSHDLADALARIGVLDATRFGPFRLLIFTTTGVVGFVSDGSMIDRLKLPRGSGHPLLFTSSGLGDELVEPPRRELFDATLKRYPTAAHQDVFHRHSWLDRPHLSVCMSRADARTVSYTTVEVRPTCATMRYWPVSPDEMPGLVPTVRRIPLVRNGFLRPAGCA